MCKKPSLIIIAGPTCVGKTEVAIALAEPLGGEIISADAMQVYRYMDIGTAKPSEEQRARVPHHLIDVVDPDEPFSAARFKTMAEAVLSDLHEKGRPVFVVGGTGLYMKALTKGLFPGQEQVNTPTPVSSTGVGGASGPLVPTPRRRGGEDKQVRERLKKEARNSGLDVLYQRLQKVDPAAAARIHPNDTYRIIRALEVHQVTGQPISDLQKAHGFSDNPYRTLKIGLFMDREMLYNCINERVERMLASGFLGEVKGLLDQGYGPDLKSMRCIGYRHMTQYLAGNVIWDETVRLFKRDTRRYAKRQLTWFRADPEIEWMEPSEIDGMRKKIDGFLTGAVQPAHGCR